MDPWGEAKETNRETLREVVAYCESRGIEIPSAFLKDQISPDAFRYAVIRASLNPPRLVGRPFDAVGQVEDWLRRAFGQETPPPRVEVVDMVERRLLQVGATGELGASSPLPPIEPISPEDLAARKGAVTRSGLASTITGLFGAGGLTPRRMEIIEALSRIDVRVESHGGWDMLRIHLPHDVVGAERLLAELFDPESRTPLERVESYPWGLKLGLSYSFYSRMLPPAQRALCRHCRQSAAPECIRMLTEGTCIRCFIVDLDGRPPPSVPAASEVEAFVAQMASFFGLSSQGLASGWGEALAQLGRLGVYARIPDEESPAGERLHIHIPKAAELGVKEVLRSFLSENYHLRFKNSFPDQTFRYAVWEGPESSRRPSTRPGRRTS